MTRPPPCRFHNSPGGCNRREKCAFSHITQNTDHGETQGSESPHSSVGTTSPTPRASSSTRGPPSSFSSPPRGVCNYYWNTGSCKREFDCRFEHTQRTQRRTNNFIQSPRHKVTSQVAEDIIAPYLTEKGLAKIHSGGTDGFFAQDGTTSLSPTEAHNCLKRYLSDGFKFDSTPQIYSFLIPLSSANASNRLWTQEEGQLLLSTITSTNGRLRLTDIINWPQVSTTAGRNRDVLSFQRGVLPLLRYMSSEFVVKSTLRTQANHLYMTILQNLPKFADVIEECMQAFMTSRSFKDPATSSVNAECLDTQIFASIGGVLHEFLVRFKNVVATYPRLATMVVKIRQFFDEWGTGIAATPPLFDNPLKSLQPMVGELVMGTIKETFDRLISIVEREQGKLIPSDQRERQSDRKGISQEGVIAALHTSYEGPGHRRADGPRHDNDFEDIYDIRIAPTHAELMCHVPPFLPANFYEAPHPAPPDSMQRLLDIQFRLLREELTAPLRKAVQLVYDDMKSPKRSNTKLAELLQKKGGKYNGLADSQESLMFNVYSGTKFVSFVPDWRGISTSILIDTPPGRARSDKPGARVAFWEGMSGKRLFQGGLIALVWGSGRDVAVHLGVIASSVKDLTEHVRRNKEHVMLRVVFFDTKLELRVLQDLRNPGNARDGAKFLVESPVMFEAIRPFLEALKVEPEILPFSRYLVHHPHGFLDTCKVEPPKYARLPNFTFQLASLFPEEAEVEDLTLSVMDSHSIEHARAELRKSRLDSSQADAVVDALTREVALIQGPPGTGKSFTGVEILRVLKTNDVGPILMIAFTNHALDHMLCSVLDANITHKIVRLGSRSSDERISQYSIETLEMADGQSRLDRTFSNRRRELKNVQEDIRKLMNQVLNLDIESDSSEIMKYLSLFHPEHHEYLAHPPDWVSSLRLYDNRDVDGGVWQVQGRKGKRHIQDTSFYAYWRDCGDLELVDAVVDGSYAGQNMTPEPKEVLAKNQFDLIDVEPHGESTDEDETSTGDSTDDDEDDVADCWKKVRFDAPIETSVQEERPAPRVVTPDLSSSSRSSIDEPEPHVNLGPEDFQDLKGFLAAIGCVRDPAVPMSDRSLGELLDSPIPDIWSMSRSERCKLHTFWVKHTLVELSSSQMGEFERLRVLHTKMLQECNEGKEEARRNLLRNVDIIGCTTTGAAKLATLLKGVSPRVLLVEEAGQVMEAHILGSLVPSIEHLILIGDPLQLRPTLNNFSLSVESRRGRELYRFDMSLMERLSSSGLAMSRIDVQRRMRPTISSLIRNTLYPGLEDHELVRDYPSVRGVAKNVFFVSHDHKENDGGDDTASKYNTYEVKMIRDLVMYLLRQGCYSEEGDIVVLCAYLGQLARLRDELANEVAIIIDEQDKAALADQEAERDEDLGVDVAIEAVKVTRRVRLRTVDNYQGEEGKIVILSLVRNAGTFEDDIRASGYNQGRRPTIGFLKSENRTNVALSRAREGLFIFGNADILSSRSKMWRSIIEELETGGNLGPALPISCHRHQDKTEYVSEPGKLPEIAPDGGCMRPCDFRLECGHLCPFKCHCDDPRHVTVPCTQPCRRLCPRDHPCLKQCNSPCGDCQFLVASVELPCGHVKAAVPCCQLDSLETVFCDHEMDKQLPHCEHTARMPCSEDPSDHHCIIRCGKLMNCCSKLCKAQCYICQRENPGSEGPIQRLRHSPHPCEKRLYCEHQCAERCSEDHQHTTSCKAKCRQICAHAQCRLPCSVPCAPCQEPCTWNCSHYTCPVPCGSVCARLPCDQACNNTLKCGHRCPSVCGEDCSIQICPQCAPNNRKAQVVDFILQRTLAEVAPHAGTLDELLLTIPSCRHTFTVETLDGHVGITDFYSQNECTRQWSGLLAPIGFRKPPTCPNCRVPITAPRYSRVIKRADLDILERNVAAKMSRSLGVVQAHVRNMSEETVQTFLSQHAASIVIPPSKKTPSLKKNKSARKGALRTTKDVHVPMSAQKLDATNLELFHIQPKAAQIWKEATKQLSIAYKEVVAVAMTRSAHLRAWEAAFSFLYEREIQACANDPARMPRRPREHAMRVAKIQVGQPRPLADRRFLVEAFWSTLDIRMMLIRLAQIWLDEVKKREAFYPAFHRQEWATYIDFLLHTCRRDALQAFEIAEASESHRQLMRTALWQMRITLEQFRFQLSMCKLNGTIKENRADLAETSVKHCKVAEQKMRDTIKVYMSKRADGLQTEEKWVQDNFSGAAQVIVDEWAAIERSIRLDTFHQPVSVEEKMQIVGALGFANTGHYYNCPNGHMFVITECGGAMERSLCPECGETIGGTSHHLDPSNSRATEFDELARRINPGVGGSPWVVPW